MKQDRSQVLISTSWDIRHRSVRGALMRVKSGMVGAATIAFVVMISGANINVVLETGVMNDLMNWGVYKLKDKGTGILVSMMMILIAYLRQ